MGDVPFAGWSPEPWEHDWSITPRARPAWSVFDCAPVINAFLQSRLFGDIVERDNVDWQSRELATVGALAATTGVEGQLRSYIAASMRVGLTQAQFRPLIAEMEENGDPLQPIGPAQH